MARLVALALASVSFGVSGRVSAETRVDSGSGCFDPSAANQRLAGVLGAAGGDLVAELNSEARGTKTELHLRVTTRAGRVGLERRYLLSAEDCRHAIELVATVTERFLAEVPIERWSEPPPLARSKPAHEPPAPAAVSSERPSPLGLAVSGSVATTAVPMFGPSAALGGKLRIGSDSLRLGLGTLGRTRASRKLTTSEYRTWFLLGGVGLTHQTGPWAAELEVRAGTVHASGSADFDQGTRWLPWVEGASALRHYFGPMGLGLELSVSPLQYRLTTAGGAESELLSSAELGFTLELRLTDKN